jgi:hypothetical protein
VDYEQEIRELKRTVRDHKEIVESMLWRALSASLGGQEPSQAPQLEVSAKVESPQRDKDQVGAETVVNRVVGQLGSEWGTTSITLVYDDAANPIRIQQVIYDNPALAPCYLQVRPPNGSVLNFELPASTSATRNIGTGQRPLLDVPINLGWGVAPASVKN